MNLSDNLETKLNSVNDDILKYLNMSRITLFNTCIENKLKQSLLKYIDKLNTNFNYLTNNKNIDLFEIINRKDYK